MGFWGRQGYKEDPRSVQVLCAVLGSACRRGNFNRAGVGVLTEVTGRRVSGR